MESNMKYLLIIILYTALLNNPVNAAEGDYLFEFGLVKYNQNGDPIDFEITKKIPIAQKGENIMYGMVITTEKDGTFTLGSVHVLPTKENEATKIMGKTMRIEKKGAVFMKTNEQDLPGNYQMEIYIDGLLLKTVDYQLINLQNI